MNEHALPPFREATVYLPPLFDVYRPRTPDQKPRISNKPQAQRYDLVGADAIGRQQNDLGVPDMLLRAVTVLRQCQQATANGGLDGDGHSCAHPKDSHTKNLTEIPNGTQMSDFIH